MEVAKFIEQKMPSDSMLEIAKFIAQKKAKMCINDSMLEISHLFQNR